MWSNGTFKSALGRLLAGIVLSLPPLAAAVDAPADAQQLLDRRFVALSASIYKHTAGVKNAEVERFSDIASLHRRFKELHDRGDIVSAITLIRTHLPLIRENVDNLLVDDLVEALLLHNEPTTVQEILAAAKHAGDRFTVSRMSYRFARYHFDRKDWRIALDYLNGIHNDLKPLHSQHALVLSGIAMQKLKKHRESVKFYQQVPANSAYYSVARLNSAVAYIRQDWWTDANTVLRETIKTNSKNGNTELQNRLYLVLGYMLLHKEYFRDAREAFRSITLDSLYANRALLGLSLSAGGQDDFGAALNALSILKKRGAADLPTDESHVLLPFLYQKLNQPATASSGYSEAMAYYEAKLAAIEDLLKTEDHFADVQSSLVTSGTVTLNGIEFSMEDDVPDYIAGNVRNLNRFKDGIGNPKLLEQVNALLRDYLQLYNRAVHAKLEQRRTFLQSYLNQCRFGLAKLLDKSEAPH